MAKRHGAIWIPRTTNQHAKAGNLNHGLEHSNAEFILELDADHIPLPWFIERTLGYLDHPDLAFRPDAADVLRPRHFPFPAQCGRVDVLVRAADVLRRDPPREEQVELGILRRDVGAAAA